MSSSAPLEILRSVFGYDRFRGHQQAIIETVVSGEDAIVLMPTGGGKSLCYQIPSLVRNGTGIVVSPLIALMQDQVETLKQAGVRAAFLNSSLSLNEARAVEQSLLSGQLDILYVAPERLVQDRTLALLRRAKLAVFAIDEAHCVAQWGHDFRPEYLQLRIIADHFPGVPRIALTATADNNTRKEIAERLELSEAQWFINSFDRPNIRYIIQQESQNARDRLLQFIRSEYPSDSGIVYCLSRNKVDEITTWLKSKGVNALSYHAGLPNDERARNQNRFLKEENVVMVATIAFGMGIDKSNVRFVAHLNLPKSIEAYYQETGRAGRDGVAATAWLSYGLQDVITLRAMMDSSEANESFKRIERHKLDALLGFCEQIGCRRQALLGYFGEELVHPCGNCDNCLNPPKTWDATIPAQQALSCIFRTGQRFGAHYIVDVLTGAATERIKQNRHDTLTTYGIGKNYDAYTWRGILRQMMALGLITVDHDAHGALKLAETCRPLLRGETSVSLRFETKPPKTSNPGRIPRSTHSPFTKPDEQSLWNELRRLRRELADEQGVPPYIIFHDATLMEMVEHRPTTLREFAAISGVGERKLEAYGDAFVELIGAHAT